MPGGFSFAALRTGAERNRALELILNDLNSGQGTAYGVQPGSIVWCRNYALAKALAGAWSAVRTFSNQFNPQTMGPFLSRWEAILGLNPGPKATVSDRQAAIAARFALWNAPPTTESVTDLVKGLLGIVFVDIEFNSPSQNLGSCPGGLTIAGGVTLPDGPWLAPINTVKVRVWQPRTVSNQLLMDNATFLQTVRSYVVLLTNYLPAYVNFQQLQYSGPIAGTISIAAGSPTVVGSGTSFTASISSGQTIEVVDDTGALQTLTVLTVNGDTSLTLTTNAKNSVTNGYLYLLGLVLDTASNLDLDAML